MAKSALVVDITALKRKPGSRQHFEMSLPPLDGLVLASAEVQATALHLDLQLEVAGAELISQGSIGIDWTGPCRRCLEDQAGSTSVEVREIFQRKPVDGETYPLDENEADLEPMIREAVLLHLPVAPLCSEECAGPEPERFPTTVVVDPDPDDEPEPAADPRWAALSELTFDDPR